MLCHRLRSCLPTGLGQAALLLLAFVLLVLVGGMFGQREHLMLMLILPYAFAAAIISEGEQVPRALALLTGIMAGVGFALKPYFVPAFLGLEIYLACRRGPGSVQGPGLGRDIFSGYASAVLVLTPEYLPFVWNIRETLMAIIIRTEIMSLGISPGLPRSLLCRPSWRSAWSVHG